MEEANRIPLEGGKGFAAREYVEDFVSKRKFPNIHNDVGKVLRERPKEEKAGLLDFGACTGLLTAQALSCGYSPALGLELRPEDVQVFNEWVNPVLKGKGEMLVWRSDPSDEENMAELTKMIQDRGITTLLARRAFPEMLGATAPHAGHDMDEQNPRKLSKALMDGGVHTIILEGRTFSSRSTHVFSSVEREVEAIEAWFNPIYRYNETVVMKRRESVS